MQPKFLSEGCFSKSSMLIIGLVDTISYWYQRFSFVEISKHQSLKKKKN